MKKIFTMASACMLLATFIGCGTSYKTNDQLGKLPSIFVEHNRQMRELREDGRGGKLDQKEWRSSQNDLKERTEKAVENELDNMKGKKVFFSIANEYKSDLYEIESITINDMDKSSGALSLKVMVKALKDMVADNQPSISYIGTNEQNQAVIKGSLNPFVKQPLITMRQFPYGKTVRAGEYCCDEGTMIFIYCGSYDFTDFQQIVIIPNDK